MESFEIETTNVVITSDYGNVSACIRPIIKLVFQADTDDICKLISVKDFVKFFETGEILQEIPNKIIQRYLEESS